ncbi:MAG: hypothetical protein GWN86_23070, partial [Desulfobacterales bacterium]|nr:hypothetical protein [Desulfobacterales bacterium]
MDSNENLKIKEYNETLKKIEENTENEAVRGELKAAIEKLKDLEGKIEEHSDQKVKEATYETLRGVADKIWGEGMKLDEEMVKVAEKLKGMMRNWDGVKPEALVKDVIKEGDTKASIFSRRAYDIGEGEGEKIGDISGLTPENVKYANKALVDILDPDGIEFDAGKVENGELEVTYPSHSSELGSNDDIAYEVGDSLSENEPESVEYRGEEFPFKKLPRKIEEKAEKLGAGELTKYGGLEKLGIEPDPRGLYGKWFASPWSAHLPTRQVWEAMKKIQIGLHFKPSRFKKASEGKFLRLMMVQSGYDIFHEIRLASTAGLDPKEVKYEIGGEKVSLFKLAKVAPLLTNTKYKRSTASSISNKLTRKLKNYTENKEEVKEYLKEGDPDPDKEFDGYDGEKVKLMFDYFEGSYHPAEIQDIYRDMKNKMEEEGSTREEGAECAKKATNKVQDKVKPITEWEAKVGGEKIEVENSRMGAGSTLEGTTRGVIDTIISCQSEKLYDEIKGVTSAMTVPKV